MNHMERPPQADETWNGPVTDQLGGVIEAESKAASPPCPQGVVHKPSRRRTPKLRVQLWTHELNALVLETLPAEIDEQFHRAAMRLGAFLPADEWGRFKHVAQRASKEAQLVAKVFLSD